MNIRRSLKYHKGLTLIELMIAMVIGLLLLAGAASLFINNKRIYKDQNEMGRLQENARFATEMLIRDLRMIGHNGCADDMSKTANNITTTATDLLSFIDPVEGFENGAAEWAPSTSTEAVAGMDSRSDAITIRYLQSLNMPLNNTMTAADPVPLASTGDLAIGELVAVTDCKGSDIFEITGPDPLVDSLEHADITRDYDTTGEVARFVTVRYYVGPGSDADGDGDVDPSLFRYVYAQDKDDSDGDSDTTEFLAHSEELIEGVENMQILYGEDTAGDDFIADTYVVATGVTSWSKVVSVRVALLMRTIVEDFSTELNDATYDLLDEDDFDPTPVTDDHRRRRVFTFTVQIRNQAAI